MFVMDLALHAALIGVVIPILFFTYGTQLQREVVKDEVYKVVHDMLRPFMGIVSYVFQDAKWSVEVGVSEKKQQERNGLIREKVKYTLIGMFTVSLTVFALVVIVRGEGIPWDLIFHNLVMVCAVVVAQLIFLYFVVKKFRPIDVEDVKRRLIDQLEKHAEKE